MSTQNEMIGNIYWDIESDPTNPGWVLSTSDEGHPTYALDVLLDKEATDEELIDAAAYHNTSTFVAAEAEIEFDRSACNKNEDASQYEAQILDGGSDAGSTQIEASSIEEAVVKATEWARGGDWDHPGTVKLVVSQGLWERQEMEISVGD